MQDGEDEPAPDEPTRLLMFAGKPGSGLPSVEIRAGRFTTAYNALGEWGKALVDAGVLSIEEGNTEDFYWLDWVEASEEPEPEPDIPPVAEKGQLELAVTEGAFDVQVTRFDETTGFVTPYDSIRFRQDREAGKLFRESPNAIRWGSDPRAALGGYESTDNGNRNFVFFPSVGELDRPAKSYSVVPHPDQALYGRASFLALEGFGEGGTGHSYWLMNLAGSEFKNAISFELVSWYYFPESYQFHRAGEKLTGFVMPGTDAFLWTSNIRSDGRLQMINQDSMSDDFDSWRQLVGSNPIPLGKWFKHKQQVSFVELLSPNGMQNYARVKVWVDDELVISDESHVQEKGVTEFQIVPTYGGHDPDGGDVKRADDFRVIGGAVLALYDHELA
jgi:hypothetical protein